MDRVDYLEKYCMRNKCNQEENCNTCMYEKGRIDIIDELSKNIAKNFIYDSEIGGYCTVRYLEELLLKLKEK